MHSTSVLFAVALVFAPTLLHAQTANAQAATAPTTPVVDAPGDVGASPTPAAATAPAAAAAATPETSVVSPPAEARKPVEEDRTVYLSFSPLHLILPLVELTGEVRLHRHIGVAAIVGYGSIKVDFVPERFTAWEVGGQFVGYPVGHFDHGMQLGVEALYAGVSGNDNVGNAKISRNGNGLAVGPFVGYKLATKVGFSFNLQAGAEYMVVRADATSSTAAKASAQDSRVIPLVNINVGWSF